MHFSSTPTFFQHLEYHVPVSLEYGADVIQQVRRAYLSEPEKWIYPAANSLHSEEGSSIWALLILVHDDLAQHGHDVFILPSHALLHVGLVLQHFSV
jgi:hypothetical protein